MNDTRLQEIERITSSNEFWALSSGDHLNMIDSLLEHTEELKAEVERLKLENGDCQDGYAALMRRFNELDKSALESTELFKEASKDVERYRNALEELRRITPYGMYHEMIDKILAADKG